MLVKKELALLRHERVSDPAQGIPAAIDIATLTATALFPVPGAPYVPGQPKHTGLFGRVDKTVGSVGDGNPQRFSIVRLA
jgi:hypothetical protein